MKNKNKNPTGVVTFSYFTVKEEGDEEGAVEGGGSLRRLGVE